MYTSADGQQPVGSSAHRRKLKKQPLFIARNPEEQKSKTLRSVQAMETITLTN